MLVISCTKTTPGYCDLTRQIGCPAAQMCMQAIHTCVPGSDSGAGGEAGMNADAADAPADVSAETASDGTDAPADGGSGDGPPAADAAPADASGDGPTEAGSDIKPGCGQNTDCADAGAPVCDTSDRMCVGCLGNTDCKTAAKPVCDTTAKLCVACLASKDCTADPAAPICDAHLCRACQADSECTGGPGVCMFHQDGHCATDAETIYVQNTGSCPGAGSSSNPLCKPQDAVSLLSSTLTTIVMRGPTALGSVNIGSTLAAQVTIIGQAGAMVYPGTDVGLQVSGGSNVYVRGLTISGSATVGVGASGNAVLRMDRCTVESNMKGGIDVDGAGFDIINTIVAKNGAGSVGPALWGGIYVGTIPNGKPMRLLNDTIADNMQVGLSCANQPQTGGLIITGSGGGVDSTPSCGVTPCCSGNLLLTADYHLMMGSPCIDQLAPAMSVPDDIDGQTRPQGATMLSDCGADEYVP